MTSIALSNIDTRANIEAVTVVLSPAALRKSLLNDLLGSGVILRENWQSLDESARDNLTATVHQDDLLNRLVEAKILTAYQAGHIRAHGVGDLVLGNYRLLDEIGSGGMGVVYRAEHVLLRRPVAIKVLRSQSDKDDVLLQRFFVEMRALARIRHPNVVWALDGGTVKSSTRDEAARHYLVMEHILGANLEQIASKKPLAAAQACELAYQLAGALEEAHKLNLIHRDIKPSNILVTPQGTVKLLDFGLALHFGRRRLTMPGTVLGTLAYMAPEQVADAANVDIRADIFGLGATLYFCLTGQCPFPAHGPVTHQAAARMLPQAINLRAHRPDLAPELETVIRRMMAHQPEDRYPTPRSVLRALLPFVSATNRSAPAPRGESLASAPAEEDRASVLSAARILIVDDEAGIRLLCKSHFRIEGYRCTEASDGEEALKLLGEREFDLIMLDIDMPRVSGSDTLHRLRRNPACGHIKVIMMSGGVTPDEMAALLALGADDYLTKPFTRRQLLSRAKVALAHKAIQDRADHLRRQLLNVNADLERALTAKSSDLSHVRNTLLYALARIVESRTRETGGHLARMARYPRVLALGARDNPRLAASIDEAFVEMLETCAPLHDIGNVALPDHILCETDQLGAEDRIIMQAHTTIGAETLASVAKRDRSAAAFWQMAIDISRHHHERHDGAGYPDRLAGRDIPLAARFVAIADAYDTLRTSGELGGPLSHNAAVELIAQGSAGRFDPMLVQAFVRTESQFDEVFRACPEGERSVVLSS